MRRMYWRATVYIAISACTTSHAMFHTVAFSCSWTEVTRRITKPEQERERSLAPRRAGGRHHTVSEMHDDSLWVDEMMLYPPASFAQLYSVNY